MKIEGAIMKGIHLRYKGVFDFESLWKLVNDWLESKGYEVMEGKAKHRAGTNGEEFEVQAVAWRNVTDYYRLNMSCFCKYWDGQYVEVVKDGKKKRMIKARLYVRISGNLILDYNERYEKSRFTQAVGRLLNMYVLRWQWDSIYGDQLNYKILELQSVIKDFLHMEAAGSEYADMW
jgi:hypothetical protein